MSKQNAEVLARTARSEAERITKGDKRTIAAIINNWNECVKQSGFWCIYDFPTTGYTRKSQLVADLLRCADQLDEYVEPNPHAAQSVEQQTREFNAAVTRVLDMETAHAEAIAMDNQFHFNAHPEWKRQLIETAHREALEMNMETDRRRHLSVMASIQNTIMERDDPPELVEACHAEALTEDMRFIWLANRWSLFWAGCDYFTRRTMIEEAHTQALAIEMAMIPARSQSWWLSQSEEWKSRSLERLHAQAVELNIQLHEVNAFRIMYGTSTQIHSC